ncbi:spore-associated protein A [Streptomyces sp. NPDC051976]|uniref:spore-associated protein A n=1 Tax=Streptomyces sp. NPDC051976 TaxID=3154947 RepID=UPI00341A41A0
MRPHVRRFAPVIAAVLTMAGAATIAGTSSASADGGYCTGNEVADSPYPVTTSTGAVYGYLHLYWNASTGTNCAVTVKTGALAGPRTYTSVNLAACAGDTPDACSTWVEDSPDGGYYTSYAGPVSVKGAGHCVELSGEISNNSGVWASVRKGPFHC